MVRLVSCLILWEKHNKMGDQSLIRGAALAAPKFNDIGGAVKKGVSGISEFILARNAERKREKSNQKAKVELYLNNMPSGIELSKIPPAQQENVASWSKQKKFEYAEAARNLSSLDPGSDEYVQAMSTMTNIKQAFSNLNNNLETFKAKKTEYLKSSSSGALSNGNDSNQGNFLSDLYTDKTNFIFDDNGNLAFDSEGAVVNQNDVPDYFNKDFKSADTLININSDIYNSGQKLDSTMSNMYRQKILNMIRQGGRETTLSLATDDLIQEGGLGIVDEDLLYNPERQDELEKVVVDSYMNVLNSSANSGYKKKAAAAAAAASAAAAKNNKNRFSIKGQENENDLTAYGNLATNASFKIVDRLKELKDFKNPGLNAKDNSLKNISSQVNAINEIIGEYNESYVDLHYSDGVYYQSVDGSAERAVTEDDEETIAQIDLSSTSKLVNYIVNNSGLSEDDAKAVLKQRIKSLLNNRKTTKSQPNEDFDINAVI